MFRFFALAMSTFLLCSCYLIGNEKLLHRNMENVSLPLIYGAISDSQHGFAIINQTPFYNKYSAQGTILGVISYSNIKKSTEALNSEDLALLNYQPIYSFYSDNIAINIAYDSRIACLEDKNSTSPYSTPTDAVNFISKNLLNTFSLKYDIKIRLTPEESFSNTHLIDPKKGNMTFYYHIDCKSIGDIVWLNELISSVVHEMTHVEQKWGSISYKKVTKPDGISDELYYAILDEFVASRMQLCSVITNDAFIRSELRFEGDKFSPDDFIAYFSNNVTPSGWAMHSALGTQLARLWLISFADESHYISRADKTQYNQVVNECMATLSEQGIKFAGDFINKVFANQATAY